MRRSLFGIAAAFVLVAIASTAAIAAKPGPGTSTGTGSVFVSNPVEDLNDQSLTDQKDSDAAVPAAAYHTVTLTDLDGSGYLRGRWAEIVSETGSPAYSPTNSFVYTRSQDEFEQVMAYYWITESQKYIQSLGFGTGRLRPVNMEPQRLRINQWGLDNSFATTHKDEIRLGKGGVDDAEDGQVITHEYGHAIHFSQNFSFASLEAGAISEGFGDYWSVTTTEVVRQKLGLPALSDPACVADWDSTSYDPTPPHCLRRVDSDLHYPEDLRRRGACRRSDLVAGALGHPERDRQRAGRYHHPRGSVRLPGDDDDRLGKPHGGGSSAPLRQRDGEQRSRGIHGARDPELVVGRSTAERLVRRAARPAYWNEAGWRRFTSDPEVPAIFHA